MGQEPHIPDAPAGGAQKASVHRILRNGTFNLVAQGLYGVANLGVVLLLAQTMGKEGVGGFYNLFAWIMVIQFVLEMGSSLVLTRRLVQNGEEAWEETVAEAAGLFALIVAATWLAWAGAGIALALYRGSLPLINSFVAAGTACALIQYQRFTAGVFRARELFVYENLGRVLQGVIFFLLAGLVVLCGGRSVGLVVWMLAASHLLVDLQLYRWLRRLRQTGTVRFNWIRMWNWIKESIHLGIGDCLRQMTWQLDTILLGWFTTKEIVGIYSLAYRPLNPLNWLPRAILAAAFPAFARMASGDPKELDRAYTHSIRLLFIISLPIAVVICCCADPLVRLMAGANYEEFREAAVPMRILIWITVLSFLSSQFRFLFTAVGRQNVLAWLIGLTFLVEAGLESALIPSFSYFGACTGSMVGEVVFTALGLYLCRKLGIGRLEWGAFAGAVAAAAGMAAVLAPVALGGVHLVWLGLAVVLATVLYFVLCVLFRVVSREEVRHFVEAFTRFRRPPRALEPQKA